VTSAGWRIRVPRGMQGTTSRYCPTGRAVGCFALGWVPQGESARAYAWQAAFQTCLPARSRSGSLHPFSASLFDLPRDSLLVRAKGGPLPAVSGGLRRVGLGRWGMAGFRSGRRPLARRWPGAHVPACAKGAVVHAICRTSDNSPAASAAGAWPAASTPAWSSRPVGSN